MPSAASRQAGNRTSPAMSTPMLAANPHAHGVVLIISPATTTNPARCTSHPRSSPSSRSSRIRISAPKPINHGIQDSPANGQSSSAAATTANPAAPRRVRANRRHPRTVPLPAAGRRSRAGPPSADVDPLPSGAVRCPGLGSGSGPPARPSPQPARTRTVGGRTRSSTGTTAAGRSRSAGGCRRGCGSGSLHSGEPGSRSITGDRRTVARDVRRDAPPRPGPRTV